MYSRQGINRITTMRKAVFAALLLALPGCSELPPAGSPGAPQMPVSNIPATRPIGSTDAQITTGLVDLVESRDRARVDLSASEGTPLGDLLKVGSPIGYQLRNRFLNIGVPISEALARNDDPVFRSKLVELARWDRDNEVRSSALLALADFHDPAHYDVFREALVHLDLGVRFGALEALIVWGNKVKALPLLTAVAEREPEPILRVYASAGLARLQDPSGLLRLRSFLDNPSWLVRAMAARYLGEFGEAQDYTLLVSRIGRETQNDFVVAEYCVAALKLFPKKEAAERR